MDGHHQDIQEHKDHTIAQLEEMCASVELLLMLITNVAFTQELIFQE